MLLFQHIKVSASETVQARIGNNFYDSLEDAIAAASSTDIISLTSNIILDDTLEINKTVNINLNNHDIKANEKVFLIQGGSLNLTGTGKIYEKNPNYGAITLIGSDDPNKKNYSTVSVGEGITLKGWSGIFIGHNNKTGYGILVNMNGKINSLTDANGTTGAGIYVNGHIKNESNSPIINLSDTTVITSTGNGIYAAGYATYNIDGAYISGEESGLGIKSGIFNILDGNIIGTGPDKTPTSGNNNGINASGTAIQIESNSSYKGNIELNIQNGTFESKNSNVIYEYTVKNIKTKVKDINITGGTFISKVNKPVFLLSDSFKTNHQDFISGGEYSSDPTNYLKNGYISSKNENSLYEVISNTIGAFASTENNINNIIIPTILIALLITLITIIYLNRKKITNLFN